jgi:hypothetical protein
MFTLIALQKVRTLAIKGQAVWQTAIEWLFQASGTLEQSGKEVDKSSNDHMAIANLNKLSPIIPHPLFLQASLALDWHAVQQKNCTVCPAKNKCSLASATQCIKLQPESLTQAVVIHWAVHCVEDGTMQVSQEKLPGQVANPTIELNKIKQANTLESHPVHVCPINKSKKDV